MRPQRIHRRLTSTFVSDTLNSGGGVVTFITTTSDRLIPIPLPTGSISSSISTSTTIGTQGNSTSIPISTVTTSFTIPTIVSTSTLPPDLSFNTSTPLPLTPTPTIFLSDPPTETVTMTTQLPQRNQAPLATSSSAPFTLTSRDGIVIMTLSIVAGILTLLCGFILWRRCRRGDLDEALEYQVDPITFYPPDRSHTESIPHPPSVNFEAASPSEFKSRLREHDGSSHRFSNDSAPSPITPTPNPFRGSPTQDVLERRGSGRLIQLGTPASENFDSRWPGRHVPLIPSQRGAGATAVATQSAMMSRDIGHPSGQSDHGSGAQSVTINTSNLHLSGLETSRASLGIRANVMGEKSRLGGRALQPDTGLADGRTWDGPPPEDEESEKADSTKTGPPAYSPGSNTLTHNIPPMPVPFSPPPGSFRLLHTPSNSGGTRRSNSDPGRRIPYRIRMQ